MSNNIDTLTVSKKFCLLSDKLADCLELLNGRFNFLYCLIKIKKSILQLNYFLDHFELIISVLSNFNSTYKFLFFKEWLKLKIIKTKNIKIILAGMKASPTNGLAYKKKFDDIFPKLAEEYDLTLIPFLLKK